MENKMKQIRVKFSGMDEIQELGETSHARDPKLPSQSFKGDSKRVKNSYRGRPSREVAYDYDYASDYMESDEFRTAVAAAAFAIGSVEERRRSARRRRDESFSSSSKQPNKKKHEDHGGAVSVTRRIKERIPSFSASNKKKTNKEDDIVPISTPNKKFSELKEKVPQRTNSPANTESDLASSRIETKSPVANQPTFPATDEVGRKPSAELKRPGDIKADAWEKTEMERITERYENLNAKILEWENEKKEKAQKKLTRNKDKPEKKRARALRNYKTDMEMIDQIAEGARAQAEENRRKEEIKVKKKADMIRLTGKIPTKPCLCF